MNKENKKSVDSFVKDLKAKIVVYKDSSISANIEKNRSSYAELKKILSIYTSDEPVDIKTETIQNMSLIEVKECLVLIDENPDSIEYLMNRLIEDPDNLDFINQVKNKIVEYAINFNERNKNQVNAFSEKLELYNKYVNLFETKKFDEIFQDLEELDKVMGECALDIEERWKIKEYIAIMNSEITNMDVNLNKRVNDCLDKYIIEGDQIVELVEQEVKNLEVDIDTLPTLASSIASLHGLDEKLVLNILSTMVASNLFNQDYLDVIDNPASTKEDAQVFVSWINQVLDNITNIEETLDAEEIIQESTKIIKEFSEFYINTIEFAEDDLSIYIDKTISEIEEEVGSREKAIDLRATLLIRTISESFDTINKLEINSKEYKELLKVLKGLNNKFNDLITQKETVLKRVN